MNCCPREESHLFRNLNFPNTLPRETRDRTTSDLIVIGLNIKLTIPIKIPMGSITPNTPRNPRLNEIKEREGGWIPSCESSYKISNSKTYHFHPPDGTIHQKCKLPCHLNTHMIEHFKRDIPTHLSFQKRIREPSPTTRAKCLENLSQTSLILRQRPHLWALLHTLVFHPPWPFPYLVVTTLRQRWVLVQISITIFLIGLDWNALTS